MKLYMKNYRGSDKLLLNFSGKAKTGNTKSLQNHEVTAAMKQMLKTVQSELLKTRTTFSPPRKFRPSGKSNAQAFYKLTLSETLKQSFGNLMIDPKSWKSLSGVSKTMLKHHQQNSDSLFEMASRKLANRALLKRDQCRSVMVMQHNRLQSLADAVLAKLVIQTDNEATALLGLQGHNKATEPFDKAVSYLDSNPYDFESVRNKYDESQGKGAKAQSHIWYACTKQCIPATRNDLLSMQKTFNEVSTLEPTEFRRFITRYQLCTKRVGYEETIARDLDPKRPYLFPVQHRNHPVECYVPLEGKAYPDGHSQCKSQEVLMRRLQVHHEHARKFHSIMSKAITAHKLMCDIDASSLAGDVEYLAKLVKINLHYDESYCSVAASSVARDMTSDTIDGMLDESITKRSKKTHRTIFDENRKDLPSVRCFSCDRLVTPKDSRKMNVDKWSQLRYDSTNERITPLPGYQRLHDFLVAKNVLDDIIENDESPTSTDECEDDNHPAKNLHGLAICKPCERVFNRGDIPANSVINKMYTGKAPDVLKVLNPIELMFVCRVKCFQTIIKPGPISGKLPSSEKLSALSGNFIHIPLSTSNTADQLYKKDDMRNLEDYVYCYGKPKKDKTVWRQLVSRKKVHEALLWLKANNKNYNDIVVPDNCSDFLPDVFGDDPIVCEKCSESFDSVPEHSAHVAKCDGSSVPKVDDGPSWIKFIPKDSLDTEFGHLTLVNPESHMEDAADVCKQLNIEANPVCYWDDNLDCRCFPNRFATGEGGKTVAREKIVDHATFEKTHLMSHDGYFRRNQQYLFHLAGQREKREIKQGIFQVQNSKGNALTKKQFTDGVKSESPELLKRLSGVLGKLPSQKEFWDKVRTKIEAMVFEFGPPTFWATFSPGEYDDPEMLEYLRTHNSDLPGVDTMTPSQLIVKDPVLACTYLMTKFNATLKLILSDLNPIGKVTHHFCRTEYQTRLMPHFHCFFWIEDAPLIGIDSNDKILEFIQAHITCKLPSPNEDPVMHGLVKKYQMHRCHGYCLRCPKQGRGRPRCKFGFPRAPCLKPILHSVASSIASQKTGSYKRRLYELQRKANETHINDYSPIMLAVWKGNCDFQYIGEHSSSLVDYISKYATKAPRSAFDEFHLELISDSSDFAKLFSLATRTTRSREMGAMEAVNFLMAENPIKTDATFKYVNAVFAHKRKRMLKSKIEISKLPDDSKDIFHGDSIGVWYPNRPKLDDTNEIEGTVNLDDMSLFEFSKNYNRVSPSAAENLKDKSKLLILQNNAGCMRRITPTRGRSLPIVYGPSHINPATDPDEYYFMFLLLHKPFREESGLMGSSISYKIEFERLVAEQPNGAMANHEKKFREKRNLRDKMESQAEAGAATEQGTEHADDKDDSPCGSDLFESVRKQSTIVTEEALKEAVDGLSKDQREVYDLFVQNVEHYYRHLNDTQDCYCGAFEPIRLFCSGVAGSGKSHLLRTLMGYQYVRSEVRKQPCHILLGAPTGIASYNVSGQTLHSMWNLPVQHNKVAKYKALASKVKFNMQANYKRACGLLLDEVSMVSNTMFICIHMRMNEFRASNEQPFGGMPLVVFGDLLQLEPVDGPPAFVKMKPLDSARMFDALPVALDLWKSFQFIELKTNHRQKGQDNAQFRSTLGRIRTGMPTLSDIQYLMKRMIDVKGCTNGVELLDRFVDKFLECEVAGLSPVCLLPTISMCTDFNRAVMHRKGEKPIRILANDIISCSPKMRSLTKEKLAKMKSQDTGGLDSFVDIAVDSRVMLRVNDKRVNGLVNGARGNVRDFITNAAGKVLKIVVKFDNIEEPQAIERTERKIQVLSKCFVFRSMFPLINSYAMTIHKSQSLSLSCVFADLGNNIFAEGMSYVALSRCTSYEGLHLLNFNPREIIASRNATKEYARLLQLKRPKIELNQTDLKFNQGYAPDMSLNERLWYTTLEQEIAIKITADLIKQAGKRKIPSGPKPKIPRAKKTKGTPKGKRNIPKGKEKAWNCPIPDPGKGKDKAFLKRDSPIAEDFIPKRMKSADPEAPSSPKESSVRAPSLPKGKEKASSKSDMPITRDSPSKKAKSNDPDVSAGILVKVSTLDYCPPDVAWQKQIIELYGWDNFVKPSRASDVQDFMSVSRSTPPKLLTKVKGDGSCWYRSVSYIVTGSENNYEKIKRAVCKFMVDNKALLQEIIRKYPVLYVPEYDRKYNISSIQDILNYHFFGPNRNAWANTIVLEMTSALLNTPFWLYEPNQGWLKCGDSDYFACWKQRDKMRYPNGIIASDVPAGQGLYINHLNRNHFDPCHSGLNFP